MAATFSLERVRHYLIPAVAALIGLGVAVGIATVPSDVLNAAVDRGGFSGILPAAASPIGATGRTLIALLAGALIAACGFVPQLKAMLVERVGAFARRPRGIADEGGEGEDLPVVRRADAHPDAPPRRPIRAASDLGDPLPIFGEEDRRSAPLPAPVVQSLPDDLDRPLADFDPAAMPLRPMAPPEPVAPLVRVVEPVAPRDAPRDGPSHAPAPRFAWLAPEEPDDMPMSQMPAAEPEPQPASVAPLPAEAEPVVVRRPVIVPAPEPTEAEPIEAEPLPTATAPPSATMARDTASGEAMAPARAMPQPAFPATVAATAPAQDESIAGLLARLERGAAQRRFVAPSIATPPVPAAPAPTPPEPEPVSLDETLQRLRRLAAG